VPMVTLRRGMLWRRVTTVGHPSAMAGGAQAEGAGMRERQEVKDDDEGDEKN